MSRLFCQLFRSYTLVILLFTGFAVFAQTNLNQGFVYNGFSRTYIVHLPPDTSIQGIPLVFNLHGYKQTAFLQQIYSQFDAVADTANFIVVYPNAVDSVWDTVFENSTIDDVGFISALIDTLAKYYSIDTNRIYSTGMSMGGFMTYRLVCELGFRIAAVASVGGPLTDSVLYFCDSSPFKSVLHIHGTADSTIPYSGVDDYPSVDSTVQYFVKKNNCPQEAVVTQLPDLNNTDSSTVTKSYYGSCQNSTEVILYTVNNGGHTWPGTFPFPDLGNTNQDIKASGEIWNFFRGHLLDTNTVSADNATGLRSTADSFSCFPNPTEGALNIRILRSEGQYAIMVYNIMGQVVERGWMKPSAEAFMHTAMNLNSLSKGIYLVRVMGDEQEFSSILIKE